MTYKEALKILDNLELYGIKFGLSNTRTLLKALGNPQEHFSCIHITGTNGKGSVAAFLSFILREAGYRVGLYTSPHMVDFRERIQIDGKKISRPELKAMIEHVHRMNKRLSLKTTYFEFTTAMALYYFNRKDVDIAVLEVGMGGRLDATNIIKSPLVSIITNVGMEHTMYLGSTLEKIAKEKAGIIKHKSVVLSGISQQHIIRLVRSCAGRKSSAFHALGKDFIIKNQKTSGGVQTFDFKGNLKRMKNLEIKLPGKHQFSNAALAVAATEVLIRKGYSVTEDDIRSGLRTTAWPGRLEAIEYKGRKIVIDGAHNPDAATSLKDSLRNGLMPHGNLILILGILKDKDLKRILSLLLPLAEDIVLTKPNTGRAFSEKDLYEQAKRMHPGKNYIVTGNTRAALKQALKLYHDSRDLICVTGSLYTVGEIRHLLLSSGTHKT